MNHKLSDNQREVLVLLIHHRLTEKEIAKRRGVTIQAISRVVRKLRQKGMLTGYKKGWLSEQGGVVTKGIESHTSIEKWRYHALEFEIKPYYMTEKYYHIFKRQGNRAIKYGNWKISLYFKKVMVWLEEGEGFAYPDKYVAIRNAQESFNAALQRMQDDLGFFVYKDRKANILMVNQHLANENAPEAEIITERNMFIQFMGEDDKVWLQYDRSKGFAEREYVHSQRAVDDSDTLEPYLLDLRNNNPLTNSQLTSRVNDLITAIDKLREIVEAKV